MRVAARCVLACGIGAAALAAGWAAAAASRVYGLEHEIAGSTERVLVFADGPVTPRFESRDARSSVLVLPDTRLDTSAPRSARPQAGGRVKAVTTREKGTPELPELEIQVRHEPGTRLRMVQRGSQIALESDVQPARDDDESRLDLNLRNVEVDEVVKRIARHTNTALIYDETLVGQVSIMAQQPFTSREALLMLDTVLLMKGFAAVPTPGGPRKIVRIENADSPFVADLVETRGDEAVTTLIRLEQMDADSMLDALRPMLGTSTLGFSHTPTNALILAGGASNIARIADVIRALDATGADHLFLRRLTWSDAEPMAAMLEEAFADRGLVAVYPDERTNTVAVRAKVDLVPTLREFISRVDRPAETTGQLHVFPVQHAKPEQLAEILMGLQAGSTSSLPTGASPTDVISLGANQLGGQAYSVVVDPPTHSLVVQAPPDVARIIRDLVAELDRVPRQVRVEVTVMEVALNSSLTLAFDSLIPLTDPNEPDDVIAFLSMTPSGSFGPLFSGSPVAETFGGVPPVRRSLLGRYARSPIFLPVTLPNGQTRAIAIPRETAALTADERDIFQRTLLKPHLKLISGEEHEIFVGDNVPIRTEQADTTDPLQIRQNIERQDTGVTLRVTPTLGEEGAIVLDLMVEVSAVVESIADSGRRVDLGDFDGDGYGADGDGYGGDDGDSVGVGDPTVVGPTIQKRTLTTTVRLENDRVAVIGYQSGPRQVDVVTGTPWFKDIPILGWAFKSTTQAQFNNHLLITVAAWRDDEEIQALSATLRRALAGNRVEVAKPEP